MLNKNNWGILTKNKEELWETSPVFDKNKFIGWLKLFLKIKRIIPFFYLNLNPADTVLDFGCGTGAQCIDIEKISKSQKITGVTVSQEEISVAQKNNFKYKTHCNYIFLKNDKLPFKNKSFSKIFSSDVLGHVKNYQNSLNELSRVLKKNGRIAIFTETSIGEHLWIDKYLNKKGINIDPHSVFHISLHSLEEIKIFFKKANLEIDFIFSPFLMRFFVFPHWYYQYIQGRTDINFSIRAINFILFHIRKYTAPLYDFVSLCYNYLELLILGRFVKTQGAIILARKKI